MSEQAATAQLTATAQETAGVKASVLQVRSGTCSTFMLFTTFDVKASRCDKLCSSAFLAFHIQKRAQGWEQEGTHLGNNIAEEFTQQYYVIY